MTNVIKLSDYRKPKIDNTLMCILTAALSLQVLGIVACFYLVIKG